MQPIRPTQKTIQIQIAIALSILVPMSHLQAATGAQEGQQAHFAAPLNAQNSADISVRHTKAVELARAGQYDAAITELSKLRQIEPENKKITADYLTVLTWANQHALAVSESKKLNLEDIAEYALAPIAKSARKVEDYEYALGIYQSLIARNPSMVDYQIAHALVLIDSKQYAQAEQEINALKETNSQNIDLLNAQLYLGQKTNSPIKVIDASQRLLALDPRNSELANSLAGAASQLGATSKAVELAKQYALSADANRTLNANYAASHVRWGEFESMNPKQPYAETDAALSLLDKTCECDWQKVDLTNSAMRKLVFDRMLALRDRHRMQEVIQHYERLQASHIELPVYALNAAGDAYLELREPEKALVIYDAVLSKQPTLVDTQLDKVYTLIELERYDEANKLATTIANEEPNYLNRKKNPVVRQNDKKFQADTTATMVAAYGDDLARSEQRFAALQKIGPNNNELKNNLANIWRWRGWLDLAEKTYQKNLSEEKNDVQAQYGLANTHLDGRDWAKAEQEIKALNAYISADDPSLKALNKRWQLHQKRQLTADFSLTESSGSTVGAVTNGANATLYSAPFNDNYRAFVNTGFNRNTFPEGNGTVVSPNAGIEYRSHQWRWASQLGAATKDGSGLAAAVSAEYRANDNWLFNGDMQLNSQQMPVRGQRVGIDGNLASIGASYRWSELMQTSASASYMHMSDGNHRKSLNLALDRRIYTAPHFKTNLRLSLSGSQNNLENVAYFNPKSDRFIGAELQQDWVTWRRYDSAFTQRFGLGLGNYQQQNFGSDRTWSISYSHLWTFDQMFELEYGVSRVGQPYDGVREYRNSLFGSINLLF